MGDGPLREVVAHGGRLYYTCLITRMSYCDCHRKVDYLQSLVFLRDSKTREQCARAEISSREENPRAEGG